MICDSILKKIQRQGISTENINIPQSVCVE